MIDIDMLKWLVLVALNVFVAVLSAVNYYRAKRAADAPKGAR